MANKLLESKRACMTLLCGLMVLIIYFAQPLLGSSDALVEHTMTATVGVFGWYVLNRTATHSPKLGGTEGVEP